MTDPHFANSLTYVCEHNPEGALGIVVNKPIDMTLSTLFEQIDIPLEDRLLVDAPVHFGGPVQIDRGFVLHRPIGNWQSTLAVNDAVGLTTSKDVLEAAGRGEGPKDMFVSLGYAGWSAGQLEMELAQNAWLTVEADPDVLFDLPAERRLSAAVRLLGMTCHGFPTWPDTGDRACRSSRTRRCSRSISERGASASPWGTR